MRILRESLLQIGALFRSRRLADEIDAEIEQHLEFMVAEYVAGGMSAKEARQTALRKFGHVEGHKENARDSWGTRGFFDTVRDFKFGLRLSARYPGSSLMAVLSLTFGVAIATMLFTLSDRLIDRSTFAGMSESYMGIRWDTGTKNGRLIGTHDFKYFRERTELIEDVAAYQATTFWMELLGERSVKQRIQGVFTSPELLRMSKTQPILGRLFSEDSLDREVVISEGVWTLVFGQDPATVGQSVRLDGRDYKIVGIMPAGYALPGIQDVWVSTDWTSYDEADRKEAPLVRMLGSLKRGVSESEAKKELEALAGGLSELYPATNGDLSKVIMRSVRSSYRTGNSILILGFGVFAAFVVLAMACVSVFSIVMCRTALRTQELAMRCALGAKRSHVVWQVVVDGLTLAGFGALFGVTLASFLLKRSALFVEEVGLPGLHLMHLDPVVVWISVGVSLATGVVSSFIPAWRASRMDPFEVLRSGGRNSSGIFIGWLSKVTVVVQAAASSILVFLGSVLLLPAIFLSAMNMSFDEDSIIAVKMELRSDPKLDSEEAVFSFFKDVKGRLEREAGIEAVSMTSREHGLFSQSERFEIEGVEDDGRSDVRHAMISSVTGEYLEVNGWELISGRMFDENDVVDSEPVALITEGVAAIFFAGRDPLGSRIRISDDSETSKWRTVVGVVPELGPNIIGAEHVIQRTFGEILVPFSQRIDWSPTLMVRIEGTEGSSYGDLIQSIVRESSSLVVLRGTMLTVGDVLDRFGQFTRGITSVSLFFGVAILVMSALGLNALVNFTSSRRRKEFGLRSALGASKWLIAKEVLKPWTLAIGAGVALGGVIVFGLVLLYFSWATRVSGIQMVNWWEFLPAVSLSLGLIVLSSSLAVLLPAWRASEKDPIEAIRAD